MDELEIVASTEAMAKVIALVDWEALSHPQKWMISEIVNDGRTRRYLADKWKAVFGQNLRLESIGTAITRAALSRPWTKGMSGGNQNYLCEQDMKFLEQEIHTRAMMCQALNTVTILDEVVKIKENRLNKAHNFLMAIGAEKKADDIIQEDVDGPCRSWINALMEKIDARLAKVRFIEGKRFTACSFEVVDEFFAKFDALLRSTPPELMFSADETMIDLHRPNKVIVPDSVLRYFEPTPPDFPHITAMCATNVVGSRLPLFFVLSKLKKTPSELFSLVNPGTIWLASTESGWVDRWCFMLWCVCFVHWLRGFRAKLPTHIAEKRGLLIVDGHTSRENPLAMELLHYADVNVLTLPAHMTHVLQLFDVGLASPLKKRFAQLLHEMLKKEANHVEGNIAATMRKNTLEAFTAAWDMVCSKANCESAAAEVGIYPVDKTRPKSSPYVRDFTEIERVQLAAWKRRSSNRLSINGCLLTDSVKIDEVRATVSQSRRDHILAGKLANWECYHSFLRAVLQSADMNGTRLLSPIPPIGTTRISIE